MALPLIPAAGSLLVGALSAAFLSRLILSVITTMGFGFVAYSGLDLAFDQIFQAIQNNLSGLPSASLQLLHMSGLTTIIFWLLNAYSLRAIINVAKVTIMRSGKAS